MPPWVASEMTLTGLFSMPPPQDLLHGTQSMNWWSQSDGHGLGLQLRLSCMLAQRIPPYPAFVTTSRDLSWTPPPH